MKQAGMVLAAGASSRMGQPKALLTFKDGTLLAKCQADLLTQSGCEKVAIVLGCDFEKIQPLLSGCTIALNPRWESGRFTSIHTGIRALLPFDGCIILPVDTVGIAVATLIQTCRFAEQNRPPAVRPVYQGQPGKTAWISRALAEELLDVEERLDLILKDRAQDLPVNDPAILSNINTPEEWERVSDQ